MSLGQYDLERPRYLDTDAPRALPEDGHTARVSPELVNVGADPLQGQVLVTQAHVAARNEIFMKCNVLFKNKFYLTSLFPKERNPRAWSL